MGTHNIPFSIYKRNKLINYSKSAVFDFSKGLKNEFETAMVNEPSVSEPLKFFCIMLSHLALRCLLSGLESSIS